MPRMWQAKCLFIVRGLWAICIAVVVTNPKNPMSTQTNQLTHVYAKKSTNTPHTHPTLRMQCNQCGHDLRDVSITFSNNLFTGFIYGIAVRQFSSDEYMDGENMNDDDDASLFVLFRCLCVNRYAESAFPVENFSPRSGSHSQNDLSAYPIR